MSQVPDGVPEDVRELLFLLEAAGESFSLFEKDGTGCGWMYDGMVRDGIPIDTSTKVQVYTGDQCCFMAETREEALAFLYGVFLIVYNGKGLDSIRRRAAEVSHLDGHAGYVEMCKFRGIEP